LNKFQETHFKPLLKAMMMQEDAFISVQSTKNSMIISTFSLFYSRLGCHTFLSYFLCLSLVSLYLTDRRCPSWYLWLHPFPKTDNRFDCSCKNTLWLYRLPLDYKKRIPGFTCANLESKKSLQELTYEDLEC
jgi:hypothetical protein